VLLPFCVGGAIATNIYVQGFGKKSFQHTFQCFLVGKSVTLANPSILHSVSTIFPSPNFPLSAVDRRVKGLVLNRLSKLLLVLAGGVRGDGLATLRGGSVGRRTAGTYKGDFGGRSCRV
jgi:hypothetical protein